MLWVQFDEHDRRSPAPGFCMPGAGEKTICRDDFREDCNLVLYFSKALPCQKCLHLLEGFAQRLHAYQAQEARILAVFPDAPEDIEAARLPGEGQILWASDPAGKVRKAYAGLMDASLSNEADSLLFILDQYGSPYAALVNAETYGQDIHTRALSWLAFIGVQCPE